MRSDWSVVYAMNVESSGHSILVTAASVTPGSRYPEPMDDLSFCAAMARPQEKQTSFDVAGFPSDQVIPSRMWNVTRSADRSQVSAKPGDGCASLSNSTSRL